MANRVAYRSVDIHVVVVSCHPVVNQIAQVNREELARSTLLKLLDIWQHNITVTLARAVVTKTSHLWVANHYYGVFVGRLGVLLDGEVCQCALRIARNTTEVLNYTLAACEFVTIRYRDEYKTTIRHIALDGVVAVCVGLHALLAVRNDASRNRLTEVICYTTIDVGSVGHRLCGLCVVVVEPLALNIRQRNHTCDIAFAACHGLHGTFVCAVENVDVCRRATICATNDTARVDGLVVIFVVVSTRQTLHRAEVVATTQIGIELGSSCGVDVSHDTAHARCTRRTRTCKVYMTTIYAIYDMHLTADITYNTSDIRWRFGRTLHLAVVGTVGDNELRVRHTGDTANVCAV